MSQHEQQTVVPNSGYQYSTPEADYGNAVEDRTTERRHVDNQFTPVAEPKNYAHPNDAVLEELEAEIAQAKRDKEFGQLETFAERRAQILREQRERDFDAADHAKAVKKHAENVSPQLARLAELREEMTTGEGFTRSQVAAIDKATKQFGFGCDLNQANDMLEAVEESYQAKLEADDSALNHQIKGLQEKLAALKTRKRLNLPAVSQPTGHDYSTKMFNLFGLLDAAGYGAAALREVVEARKSGDEYAMQRVISKYCERD